MDNFISSIKNQRIKDLKKLSESKYRNKTNLFLVEGEKCIEEAFLIDGLVKELIVLEDDKENYIDLIEKSNQVTFVTKEVLKHISSTMSPQNIMCVCDKSKLAINKPKGLVIALDGISDPGNLGAIIRTADAVDACEILLINDCVDFTSPKVVRASMGSIFHLPIRKASVDDLSKLKQENYVVLGADIRGSENFDLEDEYICLVIGNEAHGISKEVIDILDKKVRIPIYGDAESLNAAVAASILMYKVKGF